jgi:hypothetical protein
MKVAGPHFRCEIGCMLLFPRLETSLYSVALPDVTTPETGRLFLA